MARPMQEFEAQVRRVLDEAKAALSSDDLLIFLEMIDEEVENIREYLV